MGPNSGDKRIENQKQTEIIRNRPVRKITFKKHFDQTDPLHKELNTLKLVILGISKIFFLRAKLRIMKNLKKFLLP